MQAYEKVKALEAEKKAELEATDSGFEELKKSQSSAKCLEIELIAQIEALDKQLHDCQAKSDQWDSEMSKIEAAAKQDEEEWGDLDEDDEMEEEAEEAQSEPKMDVSADEEGAKEDENIDMEVSNEKPEKKSNEILPVYGQDVLSRHDRETVKERIAILETERNTIAKNANLGAIAEYRKKETEYLSR